jgi:hypothetical protein
LHGVAKKMREDFFFDHGSAFANRRSVPAATCGESRGYGVTGCTDNTDGVQSQKLENAGDPPSQRFGVASTPATTGRNEGSEGFSAVRSDRILFLYLCYLRLLAKAFGVTFC